jgi:ABC-2 type transport system permease protein
MIRNALAIARRVLRQLAHDRRLLGLSLIAPMVIIYVMKVGFDSFGVPFLDVSQYIAPVSAFVVHFITYILCAIVLVRERTAQTLARMFVNGYRQPDIIGGYVLAYTALATVQSLIVLAELRQLFHLGWDVPTLLSVFLIIWLLAVISICLGIFVSNFARTEGQVLPFIPLVTVPGVFLSGVIIAVERLPVWAQWLSHATPLYYANKVIQQLVRAHKSLADNWMHVSALVLYGLIVLMLAMTTLREID